MHHDMSSFLSDREGIPRGGSWFMDIREGTKKSENVHQYENMVEIYQKMWKYCHTMM